MVVKGVEIEDGGWIRSSTEGGVITSCAEVVRFWVLDVNVAAFGGASASDCVVNTGCFMRCNGGRVFSLAFSSIGSNFTDTNFFLSLTSAVSGGYILSS